MSRFKEIRTLANSGALLILVTMGARAAGPLSIDQNEKQNIFFESEIASANLRSTLSQTEPTKWIESYDVFMREIQRKLSGSPTPFGGDLNVVRELNMKAAATWRIILENFDGSLQKAQVAYINKSRLGKSREAHQKATESLQELRSSLQAFVTTSMIEGPSLQKAYMQLPRSLPLHPFLIQTLVEYVALQKIFLSVDGKEKISKDPIWTTVDGKEFYKSAFNRDAGAYELQSDTWLLNGRVPVLTGPGQLRNVILLLGLHSGNDGDENYGCGSWGLFPYANYSILFNASVFSISWLVGMNFDLPKTLRDGFRLGVGDLREAADLYIKKSLEQDCPQIPYQSYAYQHSAEFVKKYRELWGQK